jgi:beta-lactamase class A
MLSFALTLMLFWQRPVGEAPLRDRIRQIVADSGADVAVAFQTLDSKSTLLLNADIPFHAASTMKVPVMIELFRQAAAGRLSLGEPLSVRNEFHSIADGSVYALDVKDDSDEEVYKAVGRTMTLRELCEAMITVSSNLAANLLIERLGVENIQSTVTKLGADGMKVLRGVEDQRAFDKGLNNTTTARALLVLLERIAKGNAVNAKADLEMAGILKRQRELPDGIRAGVPPDVAVGHKTGNITGILHDAAIVYGPRPYVLVVLVRGPEDDKKDAALMASISREVWTYVRNTPASAASGPADRK